MSAKPPSAPDVLADAEFIPLTVFPVLWRVGLNAAPFLLLLAWLVRCAPPGRAGIVILHLLAWLPACMLLAVFAVPALQLWWLALSDRRAGRERNVGRERDDLDYAGRMIGFLGYATLRHRPLLGSLLMVGWCVALLGAAQAIQRQSVQMLADTAAWGCPAGGELATTGPGRALLVVAILLLMLAIEWYYWKVLVRRFGQAVSVYGVARTVAGMRLMFRLRTRQPARDMRIHMPGLGTLWYMVAFAAALLFAGSTALVLAAALLCAVAALSSVLNALLPPTLLLLSVTDERQFLLMRFLARTMPGFAVTLIDQKHPTLRRVYHWHYSEMARHARAHGRGGARALLTVASFALNPTGPRLDNLRTRSGYWRRSVRDVARFVPWIVVDTRQGSANVDAEIAWLLTGEHVGKVLFVTGDDGEQQALDRVREQGIDPQAYGARVVTLTGMDEVIYALRDRHGG